MIERIAPTFVILTWILVASALVLMLAQNDDWTKADPYAQSSFPCSEDEVLGYSQEFGADRVGCISLDQFRSAP